MGIDGTVHGKDRVGSNFISAVFLRVPAEEVIAIVGRSRQACQFSGHSHGTGLAYATTVGVKGHGVGVGRPLGIEVQILGAVGGDVRHWVAAEFRLLIPSCEGITGFEGDRQGCPRYERKLRECTAVRIQGYGGAQVAQHHIPGGVQTNATGVTVGGEVVRRVFARHIVAPPADETAGDTFCVNANVCVFAQQPSDVDCIPS